MEIFAMTLFVFTIVMIISGSLYYYFDRILNENQSESTALGRQVLDASGLWVMSSFIYTAFASFVLFIFSTSFTVEVLYESAAEAFHYIFIIFPVAIAGFISVYFLVRYLLSRFMLS